MERSCTRSLEEENELVRSTKKVKDSHNGITEGSPGRCEGSFHANKLSFKEKLVGEIPGSTLNHLLFLNKWRQNLSRMKRLRILGKGLLRLGH